MQSDINHFWDHKQQKTQIIQETSRNNSENLSMTANSFLIAPDFGRTRPVARDWPWCPIVGSKYVKIYQARLLMCSIYVYIYLWFLLLVGCRLITAQFYPNIHLFGNVYPYFGNFWKVYLTDWKSSSPSQFWGPSQPWFLPAVLRGAPRPSQQLQRALRPYCLRRDGIVKLLENWSKTTPYDLSIILYIPSGPFNIANWKITMLLIGKPSIHWAIFHSYVSLPMGLELSAI